MEDLTRIEQEFYVGRAGNKLSLIEQVFYGGLRCGAFGTLRTGILYKRGGR